MQTFLPYADFRRTAKVLDRARLGKQRVENLQICKVLCGLSDGYQNHPAVVQWRGHLGHLLEYHIAICEEWTDRGYRDNCLELVRDMLQSKKIRKKEPWWLGFPAYHRSHRSNLLRKDEAYYRQFFPRTPADLPYYWPAQHSPI